VTPAFGGQYSIQLSYGCVNGQDPSASAAYVKASRKEARAAPGLRTGLTRSVSIDGEAVELAAAPVLMSACLRS
jgi:hypothetical protein